MTDAFHVRWNWTLVNWGKSVLIGSFVWPLICFFIMGASPESPDKTADTVFTILAYLVAASASVAAGLVVSMPCALLFILAGEILNRRKLSFRQYVLFQNVAHMLIAIATYLTIRYYYAEGTFPGDLELLLPVYTACGLFVWNKMYYDLQKRTTTKNRLT